MTCRQQALTEGLPSGSHSREPVLIQPRQTLREKGFSLQGWAEHAPLFFPVILAFSYRSWVFRLALLL